MREIPFRLVVIIATLAKTQSRLMKTMRTRHSRKKRVPLPMCVWHSPGESSWLVLLLLLLAVRAVRATVPLPKDVFVGTEVVGIVQALAGPENRIRHRNGVGSAHEGTIKRSVSEIPVVAGGFCNKRGDLPGK